MNRTPNRATAGRTMRTRTVGITTLRRSALALAISATFAPAHAQRADEEHYRSQTTEIKSSGRFEPLTPRSNGAVNMRNANTMDTPPTVFDRGVAAVRELVLSIDRDDVPADGQTAVTLGIKLLDDKGQPLLGAVTVTVETTRGRLDQQDRFDVLAQDRIAPGTRVRVDNGQGMVRLIAPFSPGEAIVRVTAGMRVVEGTVSFLPDIRPWIAAGLVEGTVGLRDRDLSRLTPARSDDGFEQEIRHFSSTYGNGKGTLAARGAMFAKGRLGNDYLVTFAYDTDKWWLKNRFFRDIRPEEFYPTTGDASIKGFEAQSTSKLYARVDRGSSYAMWGDLRTQLTDPAVKLGNYARTMTGFRAQHEAGWATIGGFAAHDSLKRIIDEFPARGISGPYAVTSANGITGTELVEIITRDRNQPTLILRTQPMQRFADYTFDPFNGGILFRAPVPSVDEHLNPISIRVTYEIDNGGPEYTVAGVNGAVKPTEWLQLGGTYVQDDNPSQRYRLGSVNLGLRLTPRTFAVIEHARTDSENSPVAQLNGEGDATRVEITHNSEAASLRAYAAKSDRNFNNPTSPVTAGREEAGVRGEYALTDTTKLKGNYFSSEDTATDGKRAGALGALEQRIGQTWVAEAGVRWAEETGAPAFGSSLGITPLSPSLSATSGDPFTGGYLGPNGTGGLSPVLSAPLGSGLTPSTPIDQTNWRLRLTKEFPDYAARLYGEYEQDIHHADRRLGAIGGDWRFAERGRIYARHELASSAWSQYAFNSTQLTQGSAIGIDTSYMKDGQLYTEYRLRDGIDAQQSQAAIGVRNFWNVSEGLRLSTNAERIKVNALDASRDATAIGLGAEYTANPLWKGTGRLEWRDEPLQRSYLSTLGLARKISESWTFLGRNYAQYNDRRDAKDGFQNRLQLGAAYRDTRTNRWNWLGRYELKLENNPSTGVQLGGVPVTAANNLGASAISAESLKRRVHIVSTHADYHPSRPWWFSGQYAFKHVRERFPEVSDSYFAQLVSGRVTYDITERWDVGFAARVLANRGFSNRQYGTGVELGYLVVDNVWVSLGYNFTGFRDRDLIDSNYSARGVFFRIRAKFDENLFRGARRQWNRTMERADP